jgi:chromosome partitioning protein
VIDADVNRPLSSWARHADKPNTLTVLGDVNETTIIDTIETAAAETQFVIVDLEGTASLMVAISRADLVIIPTQGSQLDATETAKTVRLVKVQEKSLRLKIPLAILLTRTSTAIRPRTLQAIEAEFRKAGVRVLQSQIHERDAYKAIFSFGRTLSGLDPGQVRNVPAAAANARDFMVEVVSLFKEQEAGSERVAEVA